MLTGGADTGWTFYAPYSTTTPTTVVAGAARRLHPRLLVDPHRPQLHRHRPHPARAGHRPGCACRCSCGRSTRTSIIQVLATPVLGLTAAAGRRRAASFGFGLFDPARGGDPVLFQHLFWFYSHPAVYIMVLPAMGVISEAIAAFARKNVFGYKVIAYSSLGIAFVGFFAWGHHMFVSGQSTFDAGAFGVSRCSSACSPPSRSSTGWARSTGARSRSRRRSSTSAASCSSSCSAA